jgi:hypothetical protein
MAVSASRDSRLDSLDDHLGLVACRPGSRATGAMVSLDQLLDH